MWFFICQKTRSNCFSGKADAIPFLNIKLTSPKHCLSFKSMASTFPQKQSETSQSANKKMIHLHALLHRRTRYYNALFFEDAFHFQNNFPLKIKYHFSKDVKASSKIKSKKEYQILVPDKKRLYFLIWIFYPSDGFSLSDNKMRISLFLGEFLSFYIDRYKDKIFPFSL